MNAGEDPWNGPAFQEMRKRMFAGDYSLCRRSMCQMPLYTPEELANPAVSGGHHLVSAVNLEAIKNNQTLLPQGPDRMAIVGDLRCNLACPSCRKDFITQLTPGQEAELAHEEQMIAKYAEHLRFADFSGVGEPFYSPWVFNQLKRMTRNNFPKLEKIQVVTNGLLATPEKFAELGDAARFIKFIIVSIDAGTEEIYVKVRKGGSWKVLNQNLAWLSEKRRAGDLEVLQINFVVRRENFRTMKEFVDLGKKHGVSKIVFRRLLPWPNMGIADYEAEAVHMPEHADHAEFMRICESLKAEPLVHLAFDEYMAE